MCLIAVIILLFYILYLLAKKSKYTRLRLFMYNMQISVKCLTTVIR